MPPRGLGWEIWLPAAALGALLGLGAYTFWYSGGPSYFSNDPKVCVNCHVMRPQFKAWAQGPHHAAASCSDCHVPHRFPAKYWVKASNGWRHSKVFTLGDYKEPIEIQPASLRVVQQNCVHCHGAMLAQIEAHGGIDFKQIGCAGCHGSVGHDS